MNVKPSQEEHSPQPSSATRRVANVLETRVSRDSAITISFAGTPEHSSNRPRTARRQAPSPQAFTANQSAAASPTLKGKLVIRPAHEVSTRAATTAHPRPTPILLLHHSNTLSALAPSGDPRFHLDPGASAVDSADEIQDDEVDDDVGDADGWIGRRRCRATRKFAPWTLASQDRQRKAASASQCTVAAAPQSSHASPTAAAVALFFIFLEARNPNPSERFPAVLRKNQRRFWERRELEGMVG